MRLKIKNLNLNSYTLRYWQKLILMQKFEWSPILDTDFDKISFYAKTHEDCHKLFFVCKKGGGPFYA